MRTHQARLSKKTLIVAFAILLVQQISAQQTPPAQQRHEMTAAEAVEYAMKNSTQVRNALLQIQIRQQGNREITAAAFPQVNGSLNVTKYVDLPTSLIPAEFLAVHRVPSFRCSLVLSTTALMGSLLTSFCSTDRCLWDCRHVVHLSIFIPPRHS